MRTAQLDTNTFEIRYNCHSISTELNITGIRLGCFGAAPLRRAAFFVFGWSYTQIGAPWYSTFLHQLKRRCKMVQ